MDTKFVLRVLMVVGVLVAAFALPVTAGGPVCPPPVCMPPVCAPMPVCAPPMCGPPPVCPPPMCGPAPCYPPKCKRNPVAKICEGAFELVTCVVALPIKAVDVAIRCVRERACQLSTPCPPPYCKPRTICGPMPLCGPMGPGPGYMPPPPPPAYGMHAVPTARPVGYGRHPAPHRMVPFSKKKSKDKPTKLMAASMKELFGTYW